MGPVIVFIVGLIFGVLLRKRLRTTLGISVVSGFLTVICWLAVTMPLALQDGWLGWRMELPFIIRAILFVGGFGAFGGATGCNLKEILAALGVKISDGHHPQPRAGGS